MSTLPAFTLVELIIILSLLCVIGTFSALQGIVSFQQTVTSVSENQTELLHLSSAGRIYRHMPSLDF